MLAEDRIIQIAFVFLFKPNNKGMRAVCSHVYPDTHATNVPEWKQERNESDALN